MTEWLERVRGELAGRYRIERELGRGSTATVYLAEDLAQQRQVAVKVLHPELVQALGGQRFLREIRLAAALHHPHLLAIHDSGEANGLFYFVAPYLPDGSLRTCLLRERQLSVDEAVRITREIADALGYVHEHGIVHRDVKPENILFAGKHACVADFGIARAIDTALGDTLTSTGLVVGTPAYMSPEQASGERAVDARSDQYSLACVLYEMLAGVPPFVGATAQSVISQRFAHAPSPLTFYRPNVSAGIEFAVARALSIAPADRFESVRDFVAALDRRAPPAIRIDPAVRLRKLRRRWFVTGAAAAVIVIALFGFDQARDRVLASRRAALDTTAYIVAPFVDGPRGTVLSGSDVSQLLYSGLRGWRGITVQDGSDRSELRTLERALEAAAADRIRWLVSGRVARRAGNTVVHVELHDAAHTRPTRSFEIAISGGDSQTDVRQLADSLLRSSELSADAVHAQRGTRNLEAWRAFERGWTALGEWDLAKAHRAFAVATTTDPDFGSARVWLAQTHSWLYRGARTEWNDHATRALESAGSLSRRENTVAAALTALGRGDYPNACAEYSRLLQRDSADVLAWYGMGECQALDSAVVRHRSSPSGWAFRTSFYRAAQAYRRAAEIDRRAYGLPVFERLFAVLKSQPRQLRHSTGRRFAAYVVLQAETIAFTPQPRARFVQLGEVDPGQRAAALARNRDVLLTTALEWARAYPVSAAAYEAVAEMRERRFDIGDTVAAGMTALEAIRRARSLATSREQSIRMAAHEARLLLKRSEFRAVRLLADSLLAQVPAPTPSEAHVLRGLAVLTGKVSEGARLHALALDPRRVGDEAVPAPVASFLASLEIRVVLGLCDDFESRLARLSSLIETYAARKRRAQIERELHGIAAEDAVPCTGGRAARFFVDAGQAMAKVYQAYARGDLHRTRLELDSAASRMSGTVPGEVSVDHTLENAWMRLKLGDTVTAIQLLDNSLTALETQSPTVLEWIAQAGSLPRAMLMRAELAAARRDLARARYWTRSLKALWETADPALRNRVSALEALLNRS